MKRELKFRVWTGNGMEHDVTVGKFGTFYVNPEAKGDGLDPKDTASLTPNTTKYNEVHPVMQFTGLLDKNGKEIYEGDICKSKSGLFHVEYVNAGFSLKSLNKKCRNWAFTQNSAKSIEVIGSIYENPELLTDSDK